LNRRVVRSIALLIFCSALAAGVRAQTAPSRIDGPAVKVGDAWMYNKLDGWKRRLEYVSVNTVRKIGADGISMESTAVDGRHFANIRRTSDFNLVRIEAAAFTQTALPYYPNFAFPLQIGKTWRRDVELANTSQPGKKVHAQLEGRVVGWESVTVPAGNFLALKIEVKGSYRGENADGTWTGKIEDALWYAPEVRNAVRYEYQDTVGGSRYNHEIDELVRYWLVP
jgi:hypothetical protein